MFLVKNRPLPSGIGLGAPSKRSMLPSVRYNERIEKLAQESYPQTALLKQRSFPVY
jgi:hypothetical protein